jgi:hypothetical protein
MKKNILILEGRETIGGGQIITKKVYFQKVTMFLFLFLERKMQYQIIYLNIGLLIIR